MLFPTITEHSHAYADTVLALTLAEQRLESLGIHELAETAQLMALKEKCRVLSMRLGKRISAEIHRPEVVCLCGSTRFTTAYLEANERLTLAGKIVLTVALFPHEKAIDPEQKRLLDELHLRKIDLADSVLVLNVGGYIGESTQAEIDYANSIGRPVSYLEPLSGTGLGSSPDSGPGFNPDSGR
jgi:hypothetical protein